RAFGGRQQFDTGRNGDRQIRELIRLRRGDDSGGGERSKFFPSFCCVWVAGELGGKFLPGVLGLGQFSFCLLDFPKQETRACAFFEGQVYGAVRVGFRVGQAACLGVGGSEEKMSAPSSAVLEEGFFQGDNSRRSFTGAQLHLAQRKQGPLVAGIERQGMLEILTS